MEYFALLSLAAPVDDPHPALALRSVAGMIDPRRGRLRYPTWVHHSGPLTNGVLDELLVELSRMPWVEGQRVRVVIDSPEQTTSHGRALEARAHARGVVETLLGAGNIWSAGDTTKITTSLWVAESLPAVATQPTGLTARDIGVSRAARRQAEALYHETVPHALARAVALNDYVLVTEAPWTR